MKRFVGMILVCLALLNGICGLAEVEEEAPPIELKAFVFDLCGGCGADGPGCGNCREIVRYHGIFKGQLEDQLYDGTMVYRMLNCRLVVNRDAYTDCFEELELEQPLYGMFPTVFISCEGDTVHLVGESMLEYVGAVVEALKQGDDAAEIQTWVDEVFSEQQSQDAES